CLQGYSAPLTV
nr:immunoglobulin light chain junction region [Macaca mulatta]